MKQYFHHRICIFVYMDVATVCVCLSPISAIASTHRACVPLLIFACNGMGTSTHTLSVLNSVVMHIVYGCLYIFRFRCGLELSITLWLYSNTLWHYYEYIGYCCWALLLLLLLCCAFINFYKNMQFTTSVQYCDIHYGLGRAPWYFCLCFL